jgi:hypothetical protein
MVCVGGKGREVDVDVDMEGISGVWALKIGVC